MPRKCAILLLLVVASAFSAQAQLDFRHKKTEPIFPQTLKFKPTGFFGGVGTTYNLSLLGDKRVDIVNNAVDTFWVVDTQPSGKFGMYFEAGRYHLLEYSVFWKYVDYGMSYHTLRGKEIWDEKLLVAPYSEPRTILSGQNDWALHYVSAFGSANAVKEFSRRFFMQNSFGARLQYNVSRYNAPVKIPTVTDGQETKGKIMAQFNYKFGFGFKVRKSFLVIPTVEIPFFNLWPFDFRMGDVGVFNSRYHPFLINIRILPFSMRFKRYFR